MRPIALGPVVLLLFLFLLRCTEHFTERTAWSHPVVVRIAASVSSLHAIDRGPTPDELQPPPPSQPSLPISQPASAVGLKRSDRGSELHTRPLHADESTAIWQPRIGSWLTRHVGMQVTSRSLVQRWVGCAGGCGDHGSCNAQLGTCQCTSGWMGDRCDIEQRWECNADDGRYLWTRCAGECDKRYGHCYCGARATYPDRPLLQCEPRGIEREIQPWKVDARNEAERHPWSSIWGRPREGTAELPGWCDANASVGEKPAVVCACRYDGRDGYLCQYSVAMFCLNQCNFRGRCEHGFCLCEPGWWGIDCSIANTDASAGIAQTAASAAAPTASAAPAVHAASAAAAASRVRPLIYVYEMPQSLTTDLLQRRHDKLFCAHRTYLKANATQYAYGIYQGYVLEVMLHEWLLGSAHRTTDPAEADWFFVPVYATCAIVTAIFGTPTTRPTRYRLAIASRLYLRAYEHVRTSLPYWNASGGADHIWAFGYDEGACFAPAPLRPSLLISHWGNTMSAHNRCTTTYSDDRWDVATDPYTGWPLGSLIEGHPCFVPGKDLVLPSFRELETFLPEPPRRVPAPRRALFFFSGDLGSPPGTTGAGPHTSPQYSMGIRQAVYRAAAAARADDIEVTGHLTRDWWHIQYHAKLRNATFCGAFPGDGWSGGISSAVFAGCVPVIVMDGIEFPFENVLNYSAFSIRIAEKDVPRLPAILRAVPPERIATLQAGLARVRSRFGYGSLARNELRLWPAGPQRNVLLKLAVHNEQHEDALQTMLRVLLYRAASAPRRRGEA